LPDFSIACFKMVPHFFQQLGQVVFVFVVR
jgi:hypothetical protein